MNVQSPVVGQRYGQWVIEDLAASHPTQHHRRAWARCDCGELRLVNFALLRKGISSSCGHKLHGLKYVVNGERNLTYTSWVHMRSRCLNPKHHAWASYGGRGITVCERWSNDFRAFVADMGERPSQQHSIDRYPKRDGNYEPGNCRWATKSEQRLNQGSLTDAQLAGLKKARDTRWGKV